MLSLNGPTAKEIHKNVYIGALPVLPSVTSKDRQQLIVLSLRLAV